MHSGLNDNVQGLKNIGILVKDWKNDIPMLNHRLSTVVTLFSWYTPFKKIGYRELNLNNFYEVIWRTKRLDIVLIQSFFLITGWANVQIKWTTDRTIVYSYSTKNSNKAGKYIYEPGSSKLGSNIILQTCQVWIKMRPKLQKTL